MLSRFRRPQADLSIHVDETELHPGEELVARVVLLPESDFHVRQGTVALVCTENYVQRTSSQYGTYDSRKTVIHYRAEEKFLSDATVRNGLPHSTDVRLAVPAEAMPTMSGIKVSQIQPGITWEVVAFLDVAGARDIRFNQPVTVLSSPASDDISSQPAVAQTKHEQCALTLTVSSGDARSGDTLDGDLCAEVLQDVTAEEVRVALVRSEKFGNVQKNQTVDQVTFERDAALRSGQTREWRFKLDVGQVGVPSLKTEKSSVRWLVKAWLTRNMRRDLRIEQEIRVDI